MRKICLSLLSCIVVASAMAQPAKDEFKKPATLVVHFGLQDFKTPQLLRSSSWAAVSNDRKWAKAKDQNPALGISYMKGLSNYFDVSANYFVAAVNYPFRDGTPQYNSEFFLHELDASVHMKMLPDNHFFVPYLSAGIGASAYKGGRFDAFIPIGAGFQFKLAPEVFMFSNFQYRLPVTERANYHFLTTFGIGTSIGKKKNQIQ